MKHTLALATVAIVLSLSVLETRAADETLATAHVSGNGGIAVVASDLTLHLSLRYGALESSPRIFDQFRFGPAVVGSVFSVDASSGAGYSAFVASATDGILERVYSEGMVTTPPGSPIGGLGIGQSPLESAFFVGVPPGGNGIDLQGFTIDRIDLRFNQLVFNTPGTDPNHNGIWTDFSYDATITFIGVVPEPSAAAILGSGFLVMIWRRRAKG